MRSASTLVLTRDGGTGPELLFVKRLQELRFLGGFHVFPGGALHEEDVGPEAEGVSALTPSQAAKRLGPESGDLPPLGFFMCAIRELFEETGILLARLRDGSPVPHRLVTSARSELGVQGRTFPRILRDMNALASTDLLRFYVRWIAPEALPVRFDARVFLAPGSGEPIPDPKEIASAEWKTASDILTLAEVGRVMLAPPTLATLSSLASFTSAESLLAGRDTPEVRPIERHSRLVRRMVAANASVMTGPGTNTYIVGEGAFVVIDPGSMESSHLEAIASTGQIKAILLTHGHADHVAGALDLAQMTGARLRASRRFWDSSGISPGMILNDGDRISEEGLPLLQVISTPGHSSDHLCFWMPEEKAMFTGDLILGEGTTVISPPDGNVGDYMASLDKVKQFQPDVIYPGHFSPRLDPGPWIDWYISHRLEREVQVYRALDPTGSTVEQIVRVVYRDYPEHLYPIAEHSVAAHLEKLISEGRVRRSRDLYYQSDTH